MAAVTAIALITLAATAVSTNEQIKRADKAEDIQKERSTVQRAEQREAGARSRRAEVRKKLVAQGEIENIAAQTGGTGGTAETGNLAAVANQAATNIGRISGREQSLQQQTQFEEDLFATQRPTGAETLAGFTASAASLFSSPKAAPAKKT